jgi:hypothetical protein
MIVVVQQKPLNRHKPAILSERSESKDLRLFFGYRGFPGLKIEPGKPAAHPLAMVPPPTIAIG